VRGALVELALADVAGSGWGCPCRTRHLHDCLNNKLGPLACTHHTPKITRPNSSLTTTCTVTMRQNCCGLFLHHSAPAAPLGSTKHTH